MSPNTSNKIKVQRASCRRDGYPPSMRLASFATSTSTVASSTCGSLCGNTCGKCGIGSPGSTAHSATLRRSTAGPPPTAASTSRRDLAHTEVARGVSARPKPKSVRSSPLSCQGWRYGEGGGASACPRCHSRRAGGRGVGRAWGAGRAKGAAEGGERGGGASEEGGGGG